MQRCFLLEDLADHFKVTPANLSRLFMTWINLIFVKFHLSLLAKQSATLSANKSTNTCKLLVGISPDGHSSSFLFYTKVPFLIGILLLPVVFSPNLNEERRLCDCGQGTGEWRLLLPLGVQLNIPAFLDKQLKMVPSDIRSTKSVAAVRIDVKRVIGWLKQYRLIGGRIDNSLFDILDRIVFSAAMLCKF